MIEHLMNSTTNESIGGCHVCLKNTTKIQPPYYCGTHLTDFPLFGSKPWWHMRLERSEYTDLCLLKWAAFPGKNNVYLDKK